MIVDLHLVTIEQQAIFLAREMIAPQTLFATDHQIGVVFTFCPGKRRRSVETNPFSSKGDLARFKNDLWAEARETKDDLVDKAREAAEDGAQRVLTELKERAAANPLARDWRGVSFTARRLRRC